MIYLNFKKICSILLTFITILSLNAQNDPSAVLNKISTIYYNLKATNIKNFTASVRSSGFEKEFDKYFAEKEIEILQIIWINPDKYYYIKQPLPSLLDTTKEKIIDEKISEIRKELAGIFINWQRFIVSNLSEIIPKKYTIEEAGDTFTIFFSAEENQEIRIQFAKNGLCLKITNIDLANQQTVYTYPSYSYVDNLWLCTGWRVQIENKGEIVSGLVVSVSSRKVKNYFLPDRIILNVQTVDKKNMIFERIYNFKNLMVNRDLQLTK